MVSSLVSKSYSNPGRMASSFLIKDDGGGFDLSRILARKSVDQGMGLAAMDERLRMIGAQLNIRSQPGMGTEVSFSIPIDAN
jgi:two-component system, NarL family, nitrate/nitrite sensor histidine kinase NarX